jgi:GNAT superfamily N-acetyltransferase
VDLQIRQATPEDAPAVMALLVEAARWVEKLDGTTMWAEGELTDDRVALEVEAGFFFVAERDGHLAGAIRFQLEDELFWPDIDVEDSAFVHRLAVRRKHAGQGVSAALLQWAAGHARSIGRHYLRLDCDHDRLRLRAFYEQFGFRLHSFRQVGSYYVARYELPLRWH